MTKQRQCYYIDASQDPADHGGYVPSLVIENENGHRPMTGRGRFSEAWVWGSTLEKAQVVCISANAERGVTEADAWEIIGSSMGAEAEGGAA